MKTFVTILLAIPLIIAFTFIHIAWKILFGNKEVVKRLFNR